MKIIKTISVAVVAVFAIVFFGKGMMRVTGPSYPYHGDILVSDLLSYEGQLAAINDAIKPRASSVQKDEQVPPPSFFSCETAFNQNTCKRNTCFWKGTEKKGSCIGTTKLNCGDYFKDKKTCNARTCIWEKNSKCAPISSEGGPNPLIRIGCSEAKKAADCKKPLCYWGPLYVSQPAFDDRGICSSTCWNIDNVWECKNRKDCYLKDSCIS